MKKLKIPCNIHEVPVYHNNHVIDNDTLEGWVNDLHKVVLQLASGEGTNAERNAMYMVAKVLTKLTCHMENREGTLTLDDILNTIADDNDVDFSYELPF